MLLIPLLIYYLWYCQNLVQDYNLLKWYEIALKNKNLAGEDDGYVTRALELLKFCGGWCPF
jgi:hypothetical protein